MKELFEGVYQLTEGWERCYLIATDEGNILVDTPPADEETWSAISKVGGAKFLFITHRDDVGEAPIFRERLGLRVAIHKEDAAYVTGCPVDIPLKDGERITRDTQIIHLPGHSPGSSAMLLSRHGGVLFTGDALLGHKEGTLRLPPEQFSSDPEGARASVRRLLEYDFAAILSARGHPILSDGRKRLEEFLLKTGRP